MKLRSLQMNANQHYNNVDELPRVKFTVFIGDFSLVYLREVSMERFLALWTHSICIFSSENGDQRERLKTYFACGEPLDVKVRHVLELDQVLELVLAIQCTNTLYMCVWLVE